MTDKKINYLKEIILELQNNSESINYNELIHFTREIIQAKHIFLAGSGRSGLATQAFANRLLHLGFSVSIIGEISSPRSQKGDLLIICSGSGETGSLISLAIKAKQSSVSVILVTMKKGSTIAQLSDSVIVLPGNTKEENKREGHVFSQPMGSSFEQLSFLIFDSLVLELMDQKGETSETMFSRHADFE